MAKTLPKYVLIQSNDNHRYARLDSENQSLPNALRFEGEYSFGIETRFELVPAATSGFFHIRCLHNNRFWESSGDWLTATAVKPQEDISDQHCTLFQPVFLKLDDNSYHVLKLRHANTGKFVRMHNDNNDYNGCLTLRPKLQPDDDDNTDSCTFIDWESVVMLPDVIRIKEDNGNYLRVYGFNKALMKFGSKPDDTSGSKYDYEVFPSRDGGIRLKSAQFGTYWADINFLWRDTVSFVVLQNDDPNLATKTTFLPVKVDGNRILLRSLETGKFCRRYDGSNWRSEYFTKSCLTTIYKYPDDLCHMEIEEPVLSRTISNVRYQLTSARIYNERIVALITDDSTNITQLPQTSQINLKTTVTNTKNWSTSVSIKQGVKMTGTYGSPEINSGSLKVSVSSETTQSWNPGATDTESIEVGSVRTVSVPPMRRVKTSLMATRCSYDIPFSYTQRDVLTNGNIKVTTKSDGLFKGENGYNYNYEIVELPL